MQAGSRGGAHLSMPPPSCTSSSARCRLPSSRNRPWISCSRPEPTISSCTGRGGRGRGRTSGGMRSRRQYGQQRGDGEHALLLSPLACQQHALGATVETTAFPGRQAGVAALLTHLQRVDGRRGEVAAGQVLPLWLAQQLRGLRGSVCGDGGGRTSAGVGGSRTSAGEPTEHAEATLAACQRSGVAHSGRRPAPSPLWPAFNPCPAGRPHKHSALNTPLPSGGLANTYM